jgi:sugar (pentulose or hexulose) kinase
MAPIALATTLAAQFVPELLRYLTGSEKAGAVAERVIEIAGEVTGKAAAETGLAAGTPVVLGGHDYLCGALPVGAIRPGVRRVRGTVAPLWNPHVAASPTRARCCSSSALS